MEHAAKAIQGDPGSKASQGHPMLDPRMLDPRPSDPRSDLGSRGWKCAPSRELQPMLDPAAGNVQTSSRCWTPRAGKCAASSTGQPMLDPAAGNVLLRGNSSRCSMQPMFDAAMSILQGWKCPPSRKPTDGSGTRRRWPSRAFRARWPSWAGCPSWAGWPSLPGSSSSMLESMAQLGRMLASMLAKHLQGPT